jgi:hypothetical protein
MARDLTTALANALSADHVLPVLLVNVRFKSGWVYLWTGIGSLVWNGNTYLGLALPSGAVLGMISDLSETSDLQAQVISLSLSGVPAAMVQQALSECVTGYDAQIFVGAFDETTGDLIADPFCAWGGYTDIPTVTDNGIDATISITVESRLVDLQRASQWRYTHQDQQVFSPGDLGFIFVAVLQTEQITWGSGRPMGPIAIAPVPADSGYRGVGP